MKIPIFGIRYLFFYPFSVKIMLKMHQKPFIRPDPLGELKRSPDPLAAIWGLLLSGGREGANHSFWLRH